MFIQIIKDILRMYIMDKPSRWEDYIHLVEFAYNNGYSESLKMSLFEALYGRKFNTPISWNKPIYIAIIGQELLREMEEQMVKIMHNLKVLQDMKNSYVDKIRTHKEFKVGEHVFLKVQAQRSLLKLESCQKLAVRYYGPF
jgi:hypothetical protein